MKIDGVLILRITDLRRFFNPGTFLFGISDFMETVVPQGKINDFFFDTEEEEIYCSILFRCHKRYDNIWATIETAGDKLSLMYNIGLKDGQIKYSFFPEKKELTSEQEQFYKLLEASCKDRYVILGIFALFMMLGYFPDENNLNLMLGILGKAKTDLNGRLIFMNGNIELEYSGEEYPLEVRTLYNTDRDTVEITVMEGNLVRQKETLSSGECINALFNGTKCYKLLPHAGSNKKYHLSLVYNQAGGTDLHIQSHNGKSVEKNVNSFYIDNDGYVFVRADGTVNAFNHHRIANKLNNLRQYDATAEEGILAVSDDIMRLQTTVIKIDELIII